MKKPFNIIVLVFISILSFTAGSLYDVSSRTRQHFVEYISGDQKNYFSADLIHCSFLLSEGDVSVPNVSIFSANHSKVISNNPVQESGKLSAVVKTPVFLSNGENCTSGQRVIDDCYDRFTYCIKSLLVLSTFTSDVKLHKLILIVNYIRNASMPSPSDSNLA